MSTPTSTFTNLPSATSVVSLDAGNTCRSMQVPAEEARTTDVSLETNAPDDDETASETSTIRHQHEPYETFQHKIAGLVAETFGCNTSAVRTEHIKGGTFNRVVGVEVHTVNTKHNYSSWPGWAQKLMGNLLVKSTSVTSEAYIVRVPRHEEDYKDCLAQVAVLKAISGRLSVPTPHVVHYDMHSQNVLEKPYMIQKRIPGQRVSALLEKLNLEQRKSLVRMYVELFTQIASIEGPPGDISVENIKLPANAPIRVNKVSCSYEDVIPASPQQAFEHMMELCEMWRGYRPSMGFHLRYIWDGFSAICRALERRGFLDGPCVLNHGDLRDYNILAEVLDSTTVNITGIIDWDSAHFAPRFMALRSPFWLWIPETDATDEEDEQNAYFEPTSEEDRILQRVFLENISEDYKRFAFAPESFLARQMYTFLREGIHCSQVLEQSESIIREWAMLHPEDSIPVREGHLN